MFGCSLGFDGIIVWPMGEYRLIRKRMTRLFGLFGHAHDEIEMLILKFFPGLASGPRRVDPEFVL